MKINDMTINYEYDGIDYSLSIYHMDSDNYCMRLYSMVDSTELCSTWIDSDGGEVKDNYEVYTDDDINDVISDMYKFFNILVHHKLLKVGDESNEK